MMKVEELSIEELNAMMEEFARYERPKKTVDGDYIPVYGYSDVSCDSSSDSGCGDGGM